MGNSATFALLLVPGRAYHGRMSQDHTDKNWVDASASAAPALLGAAAGVLLGDLMHRDSRRPVALTLAALGLCALAPSAVGAIADLVVGPNSKFGSRRTLRSIRDAGLHTEEYAELETDEDEQMFVG